MSVPVSGTLLLSCVLGIGLAGAPRSAVSAESKPMLLHSRAAVTSVTVSEPSIVHEDGAAPPYYYRYAPLLKLLDGSIILSGRMDKILRSTDGGRTWQARPVPISEFQALQRRDGSFYLLKRGFTPSERPGVFLAGHMKLNGLGDFEDIDDESWQETAVSVPRFKPVIADDYKTVSRAPFVELAHELSDGTLLGLSYGNFIGDDVPISGFDTKLGVAPMYRTYLMSSTDDGKNWEYLSTIAYDGKTGQESFCEPALVDFGGGELLAIMRTGRYAPLYQCRSRDGGRTWSEPVSLETLGLRPRMARLENGILACSFGWRPMRYIYWEDPNGGYYPAGLADYHKRYKSQVGIEDPSAAAGRLRHVQSRQGVHLDPTPQDRRTADPRVHPDRGHRTRLLRRAFVSVRAAGEITRRNPPELGKRQRAFSAGHEDALRGAPDHGPALTAARQSHAEPLFRAMLGACAAEIDLLRKRIIGPYFPDFSANRTTMRL